jgi:phage tail-like protein
MPQFAVNPSRHDPYKDFKFRVTWDGRVVAGVSRMSGLRRWTEVIDHREGGDPSQHRRSPGLTAFEPITLERGVTHDAEFETWANRVWNLEGGSGREVSLKNFRKDIRIEIFNEAGQIVMAFKVYRCWPSEYSALPEMDANASAVLIESLTLVHEGWVRDEEIKEPVELELD